MLYLISGASRAGKTIVAKKLSVQKGISYLSLDWLVMGFTNGIPEYGLHDMLFPDEIAKRFWSFFKSMVESMLWSDIDYIIEGEAILPELIIELLEKHPNKLKICFLGFTNVVVSQKVKEIKQFSCEKNDWLTEKTDDYIKDHVKNMISHSKKIKTSCKKNNLKYFDVSKNFNDVIDDAIAYFKG
ncbi:hypothetical protein L3X37_06155 [Sabulilitoribacter arenilitoris]|uniref:Adenylate kinase n=1 Tax=Wocania arenilitoris TaxID=2044858 RepID=A0AAE3EPQ5_9FLAO|nr:hypothetical protein [Wocania arenilitoris]MCF7567949.1 hypothetical protein [Wocania arenilitoris]